MSRDTGPSIVRQVNFMVPKIVEELLVSGRFRGPWLGKSACKVYQKSWLVHPLIRRQEMSTTLT